MEQLIHTIVTTPVLLGALCVPLANVLNMLLAQANKHRQDKGTLPVVYLLNIIVSTLAAVLAQYQQGDLQVDPQTLKAWLESLITAGILQKLFDASKSETKAVVDAVKKKESN